MTRVAVLGSTGSIGKSALEVIAASGGQLQAVALSAHSNIELLAQQARQVRPRWVVVTGEQRAESGERRAEVTERNATCLTSDLCSLTSELLQGEEGLRHVVTHPEVDIVLAAIVGSAGLRSTWAALEAGKTVALANKETLVMAGPLAMDLARRSGAKLVPVDSEHSAIFQCLQAGRREEVRRVLLTASGGPFLRRPLEELASVTVAEALAHPTWAMGKKITVDSATMMNKALEIIEARWLFDLRPEQIAVVIHPQSIVHSLVEFTDGSVVAQLSPPDMKLPIQYALTYPCRQPSIAAKVPWETAFSLQFEPPDPTRFPALELGLEVARQGGTSGAVLNAADEAAVAAFLDGKLPYREIVPACRAVLEHHDYEPNPSFQRLFELDRWARAEVTRWIGL